MPSLVFVADLHLHPYAWASMPSVKGDSYRSFDQIVDYCLEHPVSTLLLGGDVFDTHPPSDAVALFLRGVQILRVKGVKVLAIQGQHGRCRDIPWTSIDPHVEWIHKRLVDIDPFRIYGLDNLPPGELKMELAKVPLEANILTCHQLARGTVGDRDGNQAWDMDPDWVLPHLKYVLLGDFHAMWERVRQIEDKITTFLYPGSIAMQALDEPVKKGFITISDQFVWERVPLKTRPFRSILVLNDETMEKTLQEISVLEDPETLVHIKYDPRIPAAEERFKTANPRIHLACRPISVEMVDAQPTEITPGSISLEGCLSQIVDVKEEPEVYSLALALLKSKNAKETLELFKAKTLGEG